MGKKIKIPLGSRAPKGSKSVKASKRVGAANMKRPQKGPKKPLPPQRRDSTSSLSSAPNLSDEDGYSAVEDVPDSDDDEDEHVFAAEMEHIISLQRHSTAHSSPRPGLHADNNKDKGDESGANDDASDDDFADEGSVMGDEFSLDDGSSAFGSSIFSSEDAAPIDVLPDESSDQPPERHVRFTGVPDTDSDSDETEDDHDDVFPDIFIPQSVLEPSFRRELERDDDDDDSYGSDTYWDFGNTETVSFADSGEQQNGTHLATAHPSSSAAFQIPLARNSHADINGSVFQPADEVLASDDEDGSSDGYETDGETTEEDEPVLIPRRQGTPEAPVQGGVTPTDKGKSPAGRLLISSRKKPICIVNPVTRKMMVIRPQKRARYTLPLTSFPPLDFSTFDAAQSSPIRNNDVIWSGSLQFNTLPVYSDPADFGFNVGLDQAAPDSEESFVDEEREAEDDGEKHLNIADFLDMDALGSDTSEDENVEQSNEGGPNGAETPSRRPSTASNGLSGTNIHTHPLLLHLEAIDRVGAFRINQDEQKLIMNGEATQESLGFSNSLIHGTLRGIKQGNLKGAAAPLTPERRPKKPLIKSSLETNQKKRKVSEADNNTHKRQRSISSVMQTHN